ncbi:hypothetical protein K7T73_09295 [Bacillus badius]|nr:hypothetical protein K7T73_09295 [Bacillus badius]
MGILLGMGRRAFEESERRTITRRLGEKFSFNLRICKENNPYFDREEGKLFYFNLDCFFNGIATKCLNDYLAWFHFLDYVKNRSDHNTMRKMIIESCLFPINSP